MLLNKLVKFKMLIEWDIQIFCTIEMGRGPFRIDLNFNPKYINKTESHLPNAN